VTEQDIKLQELSRGLSADHFSKSYGKNTKNTNGRKFGDPRVAAVSPYFKRSFMIATVLWARGSTEQLALTVVAGGGALYRRQTIPRKI